MTLKALIFDLDGVITDSAEFHFQAWKSIADKLGVEEAFDHDFNEHLKGISRMQSLEKLLSLVPGHNFSDNEKKKLAEEKNARFVNLISQLTPVDVLPGIKKFIQDARKRGLKLGIASASRNAPVILTNLELINEFDIIVDPSTLKTGKPHPEIFERAAKLLNVKPIECIGIEDAYSGIVAINSAGMFSVGIGNSNILSDADFIVKSTNELDLAKIEIEYNKKIK